MRKRHLITKQTYFLGILAVTVVYGINQFPKLAYAASNQFLAKATRQNLTEAVFIGIGLVICLLALFGLDCFRARHPRAKKESSESAIDVTESTPTQQ